ncbi:hypothetical protein [Pseudoxanthomonas putridarboris]|uniref:Secreted protein n=1 Tax=Pseudoxanthomonas putridarboris TaxID=752605 RepID=A0ABU9IZ08_9GAMM
MLRILLIAPLLALVPVPSLHAQGNTSPAKPDLPALIECRGQLPEFVALAPALQDPLQAVALGWQPLPQANMFMTEFRLAAPIRVFGHDTDHIAFAGESVMAVLDLPDPRPLARQLELETAIDTPDKAMFGKEVHSEETHDAESGLTLIESIVLNVSNVSSHPGKTLVGCSYSLDMPEDEDETPESLPELPVTPSAAPD